MIYLLVCSMPLRQGECADEFFLVTGGSAVPPICGVNNAQHLIYSVTPDSGPSQLSVILSVQSTQSSNARLWNMRVYQYECTSPVLAPVGCLQHFTGASGMVRTRSVYITFVVRADLVWVGETDLAGFLSSDRSSINVTISFWVARLPLQIVHVCLWWSFCS